MSAAAGCVLKDIRDEHEAYLTAEVWPPHACRVSCVVLSSRARYTSRRSRIFFIVSFVLLFRFLEQSP